MRAWQLEDAAAVKMALVEMAPPAAGAGEVLVRVKAAGVTPTELVWYPTTHTKAGAARQRAVPGHEFSGVVAGVGAGVQQVVLGEEVYGMNDWFAEGAMAEFCVTRPEWIAPKPGKLSHAEAASVPISVLTAWQGLMERAKVQAGERVMIHGGSGAVGVFAVQLARRARARVFTTASARNADFLRALGAERVIDYRTEAFESVGMVDVVFDAVGGETLERSWSVLAPGGRLVTIAAAEEKNERTQKAFFIVDPRGAELQQMGELLESGDLKAVVDAVVPFAEAGAAFAGKVRGRGRGKVIVEIG